MCQQRKWPLLFDHLVGELLDMERHFEAKRLCGVEVDHKLVFGRLLDG
jgi:hypothetical protein